MKLYVNGEPAVIKYNSFFTPPFIGYAKGAYAEVYSDDEAEIEIVYDKAPEAVCIRPLSANHSFITDGNRVKFTLSESCNISVEINDGIEDAVILFFDRLKTYDFSGFDNVYRFSGEEHIDILDIKEDNTAVFFERGCVVHGKIRAMNVNNLKICGQGMLTMREYMRDCVDINTRAVDILGCRNVTVEDVLVTDSTQWSFRCDDCENVVIDNVKIFGCRGNNDGFDICGSRNVHMTNCFVRSHDDAVSVKGLNTGNIENILVEKCVFWNDMARSMNIGSEISADYAENIVFRDIDVIHNLTSYPIFQIHNGDRGRVSGVVFEDIRIENAPYSYLFDLRVKSCYWNVDKKNGSIDNVLFKDIKIVGKEGKDFTNLTARAEGAGENAGVTNVTIDNLTVFGKPVSTALECGLKIYDYCNNIRFVSPENNFGLIEPSVTFVPDAECEYKGVVKVVFTNKNETSVNGSFRIGIYPGNSAVYDGGSVEYSLEPGDSFEKEFEVLLQPGRFVAQIISDKIGMKNEWHYFEVTGKLTEKPQKFRFADCYGNRFEDVYLSVRNGFLAVESKQLLKHGMCVYTAKPSEACEEEVLFTCEESDWGEGYPVKLYKGRPDMAFELGNPQEITLVYLNMPKTEITGFEIYGNAPSERLHIPFARLGLTGEEKEILLEIAFDTDVDTRYRKTLFRSVDPKGSAHMFARFGI